MDHDATREALELAAAEPGGLERLMAGDTPAAQAVAAHLAGCPACTDELARLDRAVGVIARFVRERPPADLRERTLAAVRAAGVPRSAAGSAAAASVALGSASAGAGHWATGAGHGAVTDGGGAVAAGRGRAALGWVAAIAAAVVLSVIATTVIVGGRVDERLSAYSREVEALEQVTIATLEVTAEPDVRRVALGGAEPAVAGSLVFSPATSELVVVATGLTPPPDGQEYRCWVEQNGDREGVGKMFFSDDLAYWIGPVSAVKGLVGDATFGVTLVDVSGAGGDPRDVLVGGL